MKINKPFKTQEGSPPQKKEEIVFSLITISRGRTVELLRFFESLLVQSFQPLEIILVDQTSGNTLDAFIERFQSNFSIKRVRAKPCGVSKARNEGLRHAQGNIIAFPDDDYA